MSLTSYPTTPYGILELGGTYLTELAREIQQLQADPLAGFLPQREIQEKEIRVEWVEGNLRVLGVVQPGMPNKLNTFGKANQLVLRPALFRRGQFIDQDTINHLRAPGEMQKHYGIELVTEQLTELIEQGNMTMAVLRAQMLSGGINYTDQESMVSVVAASGIPADNYYTLGGVGDFMENSKTWDDPTATPVTDLQRLVFRAEIMGRNKPTHLIMNHTLAHLLQFNQEIRKYLPGRNDNGLWTTGVVKFGPGGMPTEIAGIKIVTVATVYDDIDPVSKQLVRRYMWPLNKVTLFATNHPQMTGQTLGNTILTRGENPRGHLGETGIWVRTFDSQAMGDPTAAPGVGMQVGLAGLPVLKRPKWVHIINVGNAQTIAEAVATRYTDFE